MFVGSNLVLQWVPGSGKVVRGDTKMSPGRVSPGVLRRGVLYSKLDIFSLTCLEYSHVYLFKKKIPGQELSQVFVFYF